MIANKRREAIVELLLKEKAPIKGVNLATKFNVTRQIIVKDIAILRAKGNNILATPDGYMFNDDSSSRVRAIIAVNHSKAEMIKELEIVIKYGGIIEDVIVEHPIYGEIKGLLMIKNLNDLNRFRESFELSESALLSSLTNGVHLHTLSADTKENMELIKKELKEKGLTL